MPEVSYPLCPQCHGNINRRYFAGACKRCFHWGRIVLLGDYEPVVKTPSELAARVPALLAPVLAERKPTRRSREEVRREIHSRLCAAGLARA